MKGVAVTLLIAFTAHAQDAGEVEVIDVERAIVTQRDGGVVDVYAGCWLSNGVCLGTAQELVQLRTENAELKKGPPVGTLLAVGAVCLLVGVMLGGLVVYQASK